MTRNWTLKPLGELATLFDSLHKTPTYTETGYPMVRVTDICKGILRLSECKYVDEPTFLEFTKKHKPCDGDILFTRVGSYGNSVQVDGRQDLCLGQNTVCITPDTNCVYPKFLFYFLNSPNAQDQVESFVGGASQPTISLANIKGIKALLPPLSTQRHIASILSTYDDLIENNTRRIEILEEMTRRLYEEWFVHFRFPGHGNTPFKVGELGRAPESWAHTRLGSAVEIRKGKNITQKTIVPGDTPVVAGGLKPAYYHNKPNTNGPVITISASGANAGFVNLYHVDVWASDCSYIDSTMTPFLLFYYLLLTYRQSDITRMQRGSAQPHVYPIDLMDLPIIQPPEDLIEQLQRIATPLFALIKNLLIKNANLRAQRDLLLPKLISGQIDVSQAEEMAEEDAA